MIVDKKKILDILMGNKGFDRKADFARFLGIKPQVLSNWYNRNTFDEDVLMNKFPEISYSWLLTGEGDMLRDAGLRAVPSACGIPLLPMDAFAGRGDEYGSGVDFDAIEERYDIPLFNGMRVDFMIPVRGSSMYPKYGSGDVVACRMVEELLFVQWNKVYVIDTLTQGVVMKRLKKSDSDGHITCKSDNVDYDDFELPKSEIRSIALVVGVVRLE